MCSGRGLYSASALSTGLASLLLPVDAQHTTLLTITILGKIKRPKDLIQTHTKLVLTHTSLSPLSPETNYQPQPQLLSPVRYPQPMWLCEPCPASNARSGWLENYCIVHVVPADNVCTGHDETRSIVVRCTAINPPTWVTVFTGLYLPRGTPVHVRLFPFPGPRS